jgi:N utilization substance protein B
MGDRRQARELALQALFFLDMDVTFEKEKAQLNIAAFCSNNADLLTPQVAPFFHLLIDGVINHLEEIDGLLDVCSKNWKISRMPVVDRNIMRIATFELLKCEDIPHTVTINEAVEIGKQYGTRDSGSFINGVLDRIKTKENNK